MRKMFNAQGLSILALVAGSISLNIFMSAFLSDSTLLVDWISRLI